MPCCYDKSFTVRVRCHDNRCHVAMTTDRPLELGAMTTDAMTIDALSKITEDVRTKHTKLKDDIEMLPEKIGKLQIEQKPELAEAQEKTYASIVGDGKSLVNPIKRAMTQLKEDDQRARNVIVHGLDIDPSKTQSLRERRTNVKMQVRSVLMETTSAEPDDIPGVEDMIILGKVNDSGKAPPVLVKLKDDKEVSHVLKGAKNLAKFQALKKVFISRDLGVEEQEARRAVMLKLKDKIKDFPEEHWVVRNGMITSKGKYTPLQCVLDEGSAFKSYDH